MNRDDIIRMAREAGGSDMEPYDYGAKPDRMILFYDELVSLAYKIAAAEREACAITCEQTTAAWTQHLYNEGVMDCVKAIRARGEK